MTMGAWKLFQSATTLSESFAMAVKRNQHTGAKLSVCRAAVVLRVKNSPSLPQLSESFAMAVKRNQHTGAKLSVHRTAVFPSANIVTKSHFDINETGKNVTAP